MLNEQELNLKKILAWEVTLPVNLKSVLTFEWQFSHWTAAGAAVQLDDR